MIQSYKVTLGVMVHAVSLQSEFFSSFHGCKVCYTSRIPVFLFSLSVFHNTGYGKARQKKAITQQWLGINIPGTKEFSAALMAKSGDYNE